MTDEAIRARNWANAAKSTGPRSDVGKAAIAQNARRHGATAQPDPEHVAVWARVILDAPDFGPNEFLSDDVRTRSALALAVAEVRLAETTQALHQFEAVSATLTETEKLMEYEASVIKNLRKEIRTSERGHSKVLSLLIKIQKSQIRENRLGGKRHTLLKRYFREARAQRKRAFQDFLASLQESTAERSTPSNIGKFPKQSQISA